MKIIILILVLNLFELHEGNKLEEVSVIINNYTL